MSNVLLVENEFYWLNLICQALPEHEVAQAESYKEAIELLAGAVSYHVAIVDLNLLTNNDGLGGTLLAIMREKYPSTRRIALTGWPPTSARALFEQYGLYDLLLKENIVLQVVREVVRAAADGVADDVPANMRIEQAEIRNEVLSWKSDMLLLLDERMRTAQNEIFEAQLLGKRAEGSEHELRVLETRKQELEATCSEIVTRAANVVNEQELMWAQRKFQQLKGMFGT
jgi:ActR/RegA family two-component response regulator